MYRASSKNVKEKIFMGAVTAVFIAPIMFLFMLFGTFTGVVRGTEKTEVALPYDPSAGLVWEYDNNNDPHFNLVETKTEGDEQIFVFKGISIIEYMKISDEVEKDMLMDVIFTDQNGNELLYYAVPNMFYISLYERIEFYSPSEYAFVEYTPKAENVIENAKWNYSDGGMTSYNPIETNVVDGETVFKILCLPTEEIAGSTYEAVFSYVVGNEAKERISVSVKLEDGKAEIIKEFREFKYGNDWIEANPETLEKEDVV